MIITAIVLFLLQAVFLGNWSTIMLKNMIIVQFHIIYLSAKERSYKMVVFFFNLRFASFIISVIYCFVCSMLNV